MDGRRGAKSRVDREGGWERDKGGWEEAKWEAGEDLS